MNAVSVGTKQVFNKNKKNVARYLQSRFSYNTRLKYASKYITAHKTNRTEQIQKYVLIVPTARSRIRVRTIRYDTRCYFNVRSKADMSQLSLPHGNNN